MKTITKFPVKSSLLITIQVIVIFLLTACTKSNDMTGSSNQNPPPPVTKGANEVYIENNSFSPALLTVSVNTTVKWTNKDAVIHTVTESHNVFNSGSLGSGATFTYTFTSPGSWSYICTIHPNMEGTIVVQ